MDTAFLNPLDRCFLLLESRRTMMHVAGLLLFKLPDDAARDELLTISDELHAASGLQFPWDRKLGSPGWLTHPLQSWTVDRDIDLDYHLRRSALPSPGGDRQLQILISRLHSRPIDFRRPPWELHIIEDVQDNRFALYFKMHHSLVDGMTGMRLLARSLSTDPQARHTPLFLSQPPPVGGAGGPDVGALFRTAMSQARRQIGAARDAGRAMRGLVRAAREHDPGVVAPLAAPHSILNGRIGFNRRFAYQQLCLARVKAVAKAAGATVNDIVLALSAASLRRFLGQLDALPDAPLVAMVPVDLRAPEDPGGGNAVGVMLASLATDVADPRARLEAIMTSTQRAKAMLKGMSSEAILQYSAMLMAPLAAQTLTGTSGRLRPAFNVVISNVPGTHETLYFRGARMEASYPASIPIHGQALNITCSGYADTLNFGFIGCRDALPGLQNLGVYTREALEELE